MLIEMRKLNAKEFATIPDKDSKLPPRQATDMIVWNFHIMLNEEVQAFRIIAPSTAPEEQVLKDLTARVQEKIPGLMAEYFGKAIRKELP